MRFLLCLLLIVTPAARLFAAADPLGTLRAGHPRVLLVPGAVEAMKAAAEQDPLRAQLHGHVIKAAEALLDEPSIQYVLVGPRMLDQSRRALGQVVTSALAYRLTGDRRFLNRARRTMLTAAAFPDWNPSHFLDVAEMGAALGIGYDWLYDELTEDERSVIRHALVNKILAYADVAYGRMDPGRVSFPFVNGNLTNNWNQVCNGGFVIAALALADEEPELARKVIAGLRETLPHAMKEYEPDGAYPEGPVYWGYGTRYNIMILDALRTALGHDFGLGAVPAFARTALFRLQIQSPTLLSFNYADGRAGLGLDPALTWLGVHYRHGAAVAHNRRLLAGMLQKAPDPNDRFIAMHALWFPVGSDTGEPPPLDACYEGPSKVALFRSAWNDPDALWTGLKAGSNRVNHGHLDLGSFMLDAEGERWAVDLGPDDYDLPGYWEGATAGSPRWQYYRLNNRSHNTVTLGDALQSPDADAPIIAFQSTPDRAFAVTDLTSANRSSVRRHLRGLALLDRRRVLVQDDITGLRAGTPVTWRMLTTAQVELTQGGAVLRQNGKVLRLEILSPPGAAFATRAARPPTAVENQNEGVTELHLDLVTQKLAETAALRLAVLLTPGEADDAPKPDLAALKDWR